MNISFNMTATMAAPAPAGAGANAGAGIVAGAAVNPPADAATSAPPALPAQYAALPSGLPLFAQALGVAMNDAATALPPPAGTETDAPAKPAEAGDSAPADIAQAGATPDAGLAAMAPPLMPPAATPMPPALPAATPAPDGSAADADAEAATPRLAVISAQQISVQQNPALNICLHPAAVTLNAPAAPGRDAREPLAAAFPAPSADGDAGAGKTAAAAAPVAMTAALAGRDAERPATPVAPAAPGVSLTGTLAGATTAAPAGDTVKLSGPAQQWQEPLREALGERLQTQIGRNSEHATIRLEPPMLGRIDISIRHAAGTLQVNVTASNPEVLRQLQGIGDNLRNDLAQRQYTEVAVNIGATPRSPAAQAFAEGDARGQRQPGRQDDDAEPGRALSDGSTAPTTYAMHERETA